MKFAILSLVAAGALALTADTASAQYRNYGSYNRGYNNFYRGGNFGPSFYRGGFYNPGWGGNNIVVGRPGGFGITIGTGNVYPAYYGGWNQPFYGGYNSFARPYYGGYGYRGYNGWRW